MEVVTAKCPDHLILGEEGGISGDISSPFLWCIDPLGNYMIVTFTNRAFIMTSVEVLDRGFYVKVIEPKECEN